MHIIANILFRQFQGLFYRVNSTIKQHVLSQLSVEPRDQDEMGFLRQARNGVSLIRTNQEAVTQLGLRYQVVSSR